MLRARIRKQFTDHRMVILGQIVGQGVLLLLTPVITRLYSPQVFGTYQLSFLLASILVPAATLRYEQILPGIKNLQVSESLTRRSRRVLAYSSGSIALLVAIILSMGHIELGEQVATIGCLVFAIGWSLIDTATLIRHQQFKRLTIRNALNGGLVAVLQILMAILLSPSALVMGLSFALGRTLAVAFTLAGEIENDAKLTAGHPQRVITKRQTIAGVVSGQLSAVNVQGLPAVFAISGQPNLAGFLVTSQKVGAAPYSLAGAPIGQVIASTVGQSLMRADRQGAVRRVTRTALLLGMAALSYGVLVGLVMYFYDGFILGPEWHGVGEYLLILMPAYVLQLAIGPLTVVLPLLRRQVTQLGYEGFRATLLLVIGIAALAADLEPRVLLVTWSLIMTLSYLAVFWRIIHHLRTADALVPETASPDPKTGAIPC